VFVVEVSWSEGSLSCYNFSHRGPPRGHLHLFVC